MVIFLRFNHLFFCAAFGDWIGYFVFLGGAHGDDEFAPYRLTSFQDWYDFYFPLSVCFL